MQTVRKSGNSNKLLFGSVQGAERPKASAGSRDGETRLSAGGKEVTVYKLKSSKAAVWGEIDYDCKAYYQPAYGLNGWMLRFALRGIYGWKAADLMGTDPRFFRCIQIFPSIGRILRAMKSASASFTRSGRMNGRTHHESTVPSPTAPFAFA